MSMKKALDQTLRDIKRGVNKKVLKVPSIEQKVLDATSNEPWGPHGALLADIAQASRNYHEYQIIMGVLWKRINDTGKNWRHVYKALTVLDYLVAHGSERVIDDIKEHAYQISTLCDFQYIDSSGRDEGNNVRRKSQSLVALVSDKERIEEVRQKAASNRDKFRSTSAVGGMYRPGSGAYGDDRYEGRYGGRDEDRNDYGREKEGAYRDDERYGRYGDSYGRDSEESYGRDGYREDDSRGRSPSAGDYPRGSRSRSSDRDGDRGYDEDDHHSSGPLERKFSEQNIGAPPSYEDVVGVSRSPTYSERDGEPAAQLSPPAVGAAPQSSSPNANTTQSSPIGDATPKSSLAQDNVNLTQVEEGVTSHSNTQADPFDEFDPRGPVSDAFAPGPLAIMPASSGVSDFEADAVKMASNPSFTAQTSQNNVLNQPFDDPFGDSPFKAVPSEEPAQPQNFASTPSFQPAVTTLEHPQSGASNLEFQDAFPGSSYNQSGALDVQTSLNQQFTSEEPQLSQENDILAGILPPSGPFDTTVSQVSFPASTGQPQPPTGQPPTGLGFMPQAAPQAASFSHMASQDMGVQPGQLTRHSSLPYSAPLAHLSSNVGVQAPNGMSSHQYDDFLGGFLPQAGGPAAPSSPLASSRSTGSLDLVLHQPVEKKFETKSTVWADTLNRGLVNLNISGSKINPLSDIGIDFESLNRKEKRMEKPSTATANSMVSMGKAMGSGTGIGRAGAGALRPAPNQMMGSGMGMSGPSMGGMGIGMGGGPGFGLGMGNYGSVNQQPMGMGMGMNMGMNLGVGQGVSMQPSMGQGVPMQPPMGQGVPMQPPIGQGVPMQPSMGQGLAPGSNMSNYQMMGRGGYPPQQTYQYGGGYR
ncbi:hypothetical protein RND81_06G079600 [Saponaria officinalis]|uniref:ENTH domain-containing protein n=1 Tax=Saponaria officinalis TaxID=3572 RepID=A0AAW1K8L6_SAPOF